MAATLKEELPLVYEALIGERDLYMAHAIADAGASSTLSTTTTKTTGTGTRTGTEGVLVGVVGMMHLDGIEKHLVAEYGYKIVSTNCPRNADEVVESNKWSPSRSYENIIIS